VSRRTSASLAALELVRLEDRGEVTSEPIVDGVLPKPEGAELPTRYHAVLHARKPRDVPIQCVPSTFPAHAPGFVDRIRHRAIVAKHA
jgi:hypothetical protein